MTFHELTIILIDFIEKNKSQYNIEYQDTIKSIKEYINELEETYRQIEKEGK